MSLVVEATLAWLSFPKAQGKQRHALNVLHGAHFPLAAHNHVPMAARVLSSPFKLRCVLSHEVIGVFSTPTKQTSMALFAAKEYIRTIFQSIGTPFSCKIHYEYTCTTVSQFTYSVLCETNTPQFKQSMVAR